MKTMLRYLFGILRDKDRRMKNKKTKQKIVKDG
jgi:hypothetical protein